MSRYARHDIEGAFDRTYWEYLTGHRGVFDRTKNDTVTWRKRATRRNITAMDESRNNKKRAMIRGNRMGKSAVLKRRFDYDKKFPICKTRRGNMKPIGPLMWEHRLIEKMMQVAGAKADEMEKTGKIDTSFVEVVIDFMKIYADRTHHGKEEEILFRTLQDKNLSPEHARMMNELTDEHSQSRLRTRTLMETNSHYAHGEKGTRDEIVSLLRETAVFYPRHIEKEDKHFFHESQRYLSNEESDRMLASFWEFDRRMIHEKYEQVVKNFLGDQGLPGGRP